MAAEGIMTLAPESAPQGPMPTAPQQMDPAMQQQAMQAFMDQDSDEFEQGVDENISEDPALAQQIQQILSTMGLTEEVKNALLTVIQAIFENPGEYAEIRQELLAIGFPEELLPENLDIEFFSTLRFALLRAPVSEPVQKFKDGGPVSLKPVAQFLQEQGREGDTILAHINPQEAAMLKRMGGAGTINPVTGLLEYKKKWFKSAVKSVTGAVKSVAKAVVSVVKPVVNAVKAVVKPIADGVKKLLSNPLVRGIATVAAAVFAAPIAAPILAGFGVTGAVATGVTAMATTTGIGLLAGEKPKDALKQGLAAGLTAGVIDYGATKIGDFFSASPVDPAGAGNVSAPGAAGNVQAPGGVNQYLQPGSEAQTFGTLRSASAPAPTLAPASNVLQSGANVTAAPTGIFDKAVDIAKDVGKGALKTVGDIGKTALTTVGTGYLLQQLGGKEPQPDPNDVPGGGPTGMELLMEDPAKYGVTIGDITTSYGTPSTQTPSESQGTQFGTVADISVGQPGETQATPSPGVIPNLPNSGSIYNIPTPDFSTVSSTPAFQLGQTRGPTQDELNDPTSPFYNPFAAQLAASKPEVQTFAKGGIVGLQQFASGGNATKTAAQLKAAELAKLAQSQKRQDAQRQQAAQYSAQVAAAKKAKEAPALAAAEKKRQEELKKQRDQLIQQEAAARRGEQAKAALAAQKQAEEAARVEAERQAAIARQAEEARAAEQARVEAARQAEEARAAEQARVEAARQAEIARQAEEARQAEIARQAEAARINEGVSQFRTMFASGLTPTIQDQAIASALEADRAANPRSYMTSTQIADLDAEQAMQAELARIAEQRRLFDEQQAAAQKERERQAALAKAAADFEAYKQSFSAPAPVVSTTPATSAPPSITTGNVASIAPGGIGSTAPVTSVPIIPTTPGITESVVYGPDGTEYASPAEAMAAGVYTYSTARPTATVPTFSFNQPSSSTNPFAFNTSGSTFNVPAVGFAQGGIAAMAPSRFRTGSPASGVMSFPRKTGPINGPGTGTSDSIPAMLSDGEFVFTAKAVRNFGNGSRREGAKKMYQMMKALERKS